MEIPHDRFIRLAGPDCFNKKPDYKGGGQGPSTAETFAAKGIYISPGDPNRQLKIRQFRERLLIQDDGKPNMLIMEHCKHFIRTIPTLCYDPDVDGDIDTDQEDHIFDSACHICMARPLSMELPRKRTTSYDRRIEALYEGDSDDEFERQHLRHTIQTDREYVGNYDFGDLDYFDDGDLPDNSDLVETT